MFEYLITVKHGTWKNKYEKSIVAEDIIKAEAIIYIKIYFSFKLMVIKSCLIQKN